MTKSEELLFSFLYINSHHIAPHLVLIPWLLRKILLAIQFLPLQSTRSRSHYQHGRIMSDMKREKLVS